MFNYVVAYHPHAKPMPLFRKKPPKAGVPSPEEWKAIVVRETDRVTLALLAANDRSSTTTVRKLSDLDDDFLQVRVVDRLAERGDPRCVYHLLRALLDPELTEMVRVRAARALEALREPRAVEPLLNYVARRGQGQEIVHAARETLDVLITDARCMEAFVDALEGEHPGVRFEAACWLAEFGDWRAMDVLIAAFGDPSSSPSDRDRAAWYLGWLARERGDHGLVEVLIAARDDPDRDRRRPAFHALSESADPSGFEDVVRRLQRDEVHARQSAEHVVDELSDARSA